MRRSFLAAMPRLSRRHLLGSSIAVAAVAGGSPRHAAAQDTQVDVYNWDTYIGEDTVEQFTEATGIEVRYDLFASNDELFGKLREGNPGYDVCFPSNNFVERMSAPRMLVPFDKAKIPNLAHISPLFAQAPYDPGMAHSAPYFWGTQGIGFRRSVATPTSWSALLTEQAHQGRIALLNDTDIIRMALKFLGHSLNSADPAEIEAATRLLLEAKPLVKTFAPDSGQDLLLSGEVDFALENSGDIAQVQAEDDDIGYVVPVEGALLWTDCMVIPTGAPHPGAAHAFINYVLTPEVHGQIATEIRYACPNEAALAFIPEADRTDPQIYPDEAVLTKCEFARYLGEAGEKLFESALTRILVG